MWVRNVKPNLLGTVFLSKITQDFVNQVAVELTLAKTGLSVDIFLGPCEIHLVNFEGPLQILKGPSIEIHCQF